MNMIKGIPYGKSDFETVNKENDYYVDKTSYIPEIEKTPFVFLIRPRRFGKSLFLSTLQSYYDIKKKDKFEEFYKDTYILENPTENRAKYLVMYFNFSAVLKDKDKVQDDFNSYCIMEINAFLNTYQDCIPDVVIQNVNEKQTAHEKLQALSIGLRKSEYKRITRQAGYFKQFFTNLKLFASGSGSGLARMFITGVSPNVIKLRFLDVFEESN